MEREYDQAIFNLEKAVGVAQSGKNAYTLMNARQRLVLVAYLKNDAKQFYEYAQEFSKAERELIEKEETARYVIRYHITFGDFHYDKLFNGGAQQQFDENFRTAFRSYSDAIAYARQYAEGSVVSTHEIFSDRILALLKIRGISQNLQDQLLNDWLERKLEPAELQRYLNF
jgi:hypothetical protein